MIELRHYQHAEPLVDPLDCFRLRCEARAYLVAAGELMLHEAVDGLQADAERDGLVRDIGPDQIQAIMATAFQEVGYG